MSDERQYQFDLLLEADAPAPLEELAIENELVRVASARWDGELLELQACVTEPPRKNRWPDFEILSEIDTYGPAPQLIFAWACNVGALARAAARALGSLGAVLAPLEPQWLEFEIAPEGFDKTALAGVSAGVRSTAGHVRVIAVMHNQTCSDEVAAELRDALDHADRSDYRHYPAVAAHPFADQVSINAVLGELLVMDSVEGLSNACAHLAIDLDTMITDQRIRLTTPRLSFRAEPAGPARLRPLRHTTSRPLSDL